MFENSDNYKKYINRNFKIKENNTHIYQLSVSSLLKKKSPKNPLILFTKF